MRSSKPYPLSPFEEVVGEFVAYRDEGDAIVVLLKGFSVRLPCVSLTTIRPLLLKPGDEIAILRTDEADNPVRVMCLVSGGDEQE